MNHLHIAYTCQDATHAITHLHSATTLLVDPPRKGLDPTLLRAIQTWSGDLFYISCDFHSFQRDATQLLAAGWSIQKAKGYLFFPGTNHIEILTHFKR
jgi:tRNA/tmRNA/rRNA uracil-C5-methylase (TrmA/RlmC/RlmD family)